jgi:nitronate monooxygenase
VTTLSTEWSWHGHEQELSADHHAHQALVAIAAADDRLAPINAGRGVAMLRTVRPAVEVIDQLCAEAARLFDRPVRPSVSHT